MAPAGEAVPDLLVVLDSSRSMEGPKMGTKTHKATLAAFKACWFAHSKGAEIAAINFSEKYLALPWTRDLSAVEDVLVEFFSTRTHIPGKAIRTLAEQRPGCLILCITDTHIQNLYQEWDDIKKASEAGKFVLFCIDQAYKDKHVEEALAGLGHGILHQPPGGSCLSGGGCHRASLLRGKFYLLAVDCTFWRAGIG